MWLWAESKDTVRRHGGQDPPLGSPIGGDWQVILHITSLANKLISYLEWHVPVYEDEIVIEHDRVTWQITIFEVNFVVWCSAPKRKDLSGTLRAGCIARQDCKCKCLYLRINKAPSNPHLCCSPSEHLVEDPLVPWIQANLHREDLSVDWAALLKSMVSKSHGGQQSCKGRASNE